MKRFTTRQQIESVIDAEKQRAIDLLKEAESMEATARQLFKIPNMVEDAKFRMEGAQKLRKTSARIIDIKLKKLGAKVAELETLPCIKLDGAPGIGDTSVSTKLGKL